MAHEKTPPALIGQFTISIALAEASKGLDDGLNFLASEVHCVDPSEFHDRLLQRPSP